MYPPMEVTGQLRLERLSKKKGTAPIQLTFCWDNHRLRLSTGEYCRPADWNAKTGRVKDKPGTYAEPINAVLNRWTLVAQQAHQETRRNGEQLGPAEMETEIRNRYRQQLAQARGVPETALPALQRRHLGLLEYMTQWCTFMESRVNLATGRPLSKTYLRRLRHLSEDLTAFSERQQYPLTFRSLNQEFYDTFQHYQLSVLGNEANTFSGYIKNIKNFLYWCEKRQLPVNPQFHDWVAKESYVGADFLTASELQRWASVDLTTPQVRERLLAHFPLFERVQGRRNLTLEDHLQRLGHARDKFLLCAYTGLRISDADKLAPQHIHGELIRIEAGKTGVMCLIPFIDDDVLKPVELVTRYAGQGLATCLPAVHELDAYLPHVAYFAGISRLRVTSRIGRKTFVTTRIYQGVPRTQVMVATGHQTEKSFIRYLGTDEQALVESYRRAARQAP